MESSSQTDNVTTVDRIKVTRVFPLFEKQVLTVHVVAGGLDRGWFGPVELRCDETRIAMRCVGVGETGGEPAVMLRPAQSNPRTLEEIAAALGHEPARAMYLRRVVASDMR